MATTKSLPGTMIVNCVDGAVNEWTAENRVPADVTELVREMQDWVEFQGRLSPMGKSIEIRVQALGSSPSLSGTSSGAKAGGSVAGKKRARRATGRKRAAARPRAKKGRRPARRGGR